MLFNFVRCVIVCCSPGSGDRSQHYWVYFAHLYSIIKHGVTLPNPAVVTVRSDAGFERAAQMEVVKAKVCGGDGHPASSTGMLQPYAEPCHTVSTNELKHLCLSVWFGEVGLASP